MAPRTKEQFEILREERKEQIIKAAFEVFAQKGYHNSSVAQVAKKAKISKGLMYNYFDGKEDLLRAIIHQINEEIAREFDFSNQKPLTDKAVLEWIDKSFDIVVQNPARWKFYISLSMQPDVMPIFMEVAHESIKTFFIRFIQYFTEKGVENPQLWVRYISALIDGLQMHILMDPNSFPIQEIKPLIKQYILSKNNK